jgi:hypothetical protein
MNTEILTPTNILIVVELFLLLNYIVFRLLEGLFKYLFKKKKNYSIKIKNYPQKPLKREKQAPQLNDEGYLDYTQLN